MPGKRNNYLEGSEIHVIIYRLNTFKYLTFFLLFLLSFSGRATTDSYTITASPSSGLLGLGSSAMYSCFDDRTKSNSNLDGKSSLLSDYERIYQKEGLDKISRAQSSLSEKASLNKQLTGELPIGHGCSLTQTVFNGKLFCSGAPLQF